VVGWGARARMRAVSASDWGAPSPPRIDLTAARGGSGHGSPEGLFRGSYSRSSFFVVVLRR